MKSYLQAQWTDPLPRYRLFTCLWCYLALVRIPKSPRILISSNTISPAQRSIACCCMVPSSRSVVQLKKVQIHEIKIRNRMKLNHAAVLFTTRRRDRKDGHGNHQSRYLLLICFFQLLRLRCAFPLTAAEAVTIGVLVDT
jgi:hypothetical protein